MTPAPSPQVLIARRGPPGLTAAVVLASYGIGARAVDAKLGPTAQSWALVVQARTLELWHKLGLAAIAYSNGRLLNRGRPLLNFAELGAGQTPYPFLLLFEQSKTERLLLDRLAQLGVSVDWGLQVREVSVCGDGVEVTLRRHSEGTTSTEVVAPRWTPALAQRCNPTAAAAALGMYFCTPSGDTFRTPHFSMS